MDPTQRLRQSLGLLDAIKRRIAGVPETVNNVLDEADVPEPTLIVETQAATQVILTEEKEEKEDDNDDDDLDFGSSMLATCDVQKLPQLSLPNTSFAKPTQKVSIMEQTQDLPPTNKFNSTITQEITQKIQPTPSHDQAIPSQTQVITEVAPSQTQLINQLEPSQPQIFLDSDSESDDEQPLSEEARQKKILEIAAKKRAERELAEQVSQTPLSDDELEIHPKTTVYNSQRNAASKKDLQEAEKFLSIQKRHQDIKPEFFGSSSSAKHQLMAQFDDSSDDDLMDRRFVLSPTTSPPRASEKHHPTQSLPLQDPISRYTASLNPNSDTIELDSDDDEITPLTKDKVLEIKSKFLRKILGEDAKRANIPVSVRKLVMGTAVGKSKMTKAMLALRVANSAQLEVMRKQDPNFQILEEMERDEKMMGSLLEKEIERNRRLRRRERAKSRAQSKQDADEVILESDASVADSIYSSEDEVENNESEVDDDIPSLQSRKDDAFMFEGSPALAGDLGVGISKGSIAPIATSDEGDGEPFALVQFGAPLPEPVEVIEADATILSFTDTSMLDATQHDSTQRDSEEELDDEVVNVAALKRGRRKIAAMAAPTEVPLAVELEAQRLELAEKQKKFDLKLRQQEQKSKKRRRALENNKELQEILQGEAVESDDEWQGIGGADGEVSDVADSEDERMIDNALDLDLNDDEVRKKFMEEYQIKDQAELEKLLDDIKNHRLTKRAAARGLELELSDDEDELLMAYRRQKRQEQLARLAANRATNDKMINEMHQAFFAENEESQPAAIDIDRDESSSEGDDVEKVTIKADFVHKQLSFLQRADDDINRANALAKLQHGFLDDDDIDDISTLKSKCFDNLGADLLKRTIEEVDGGDTDADDDEDSVPSFKRRLMVQLFRNNSEQVIINEGKPTFLGVTINNRYKSALGAQASISYLLKLGATSMKVALSKQEIINRQLQAVKKHRSNVFTTLGFD